MYCKRAFQPFPTTGRDEGLNDILHVHLDNFKINPTPNTDGLINKLVTVFAFAPAPKTIL